ncbi:DUF917 domain-containing protein [Candidatus Bipolaricaulota bacterium]|nr:DUF917 domain-containing protein [Candidatus Bipolaricaulota bacterium]
MTVLKSKQEIEDFVRGCTFLGTGGGGAAESGVRWLTGLLEQGKTPGFVSADEVKDGVWTMCCYLMGTIAPETDEVRRRKEQFGLTKRIYDNMPAEAGKELAKYAKIDVGAIVPLEIGGGATPSALAAGAIFGVPVVDGDYSGGRAIPEVPQTTPIIYDRGMWPMASADAYGNRAVITEASSFEMAERMGKMLSAASFELVGNAAFLMKADVMKKTVVHGTLTRSYEIGKAIRRARETGKDPVEAARETSNGFLLFRGRVTKKNWESRDGYLWGDHTIDGDGPFAGNTYKIWYKNENHVTWLNGTPHVTSPDLVIVVDERTGEPLTNTVIKEGDRVAVIGIAAAEAFTTPKGIDLLGPRHFGFDIDYRPIAEVLKKA